MADLVQTRSADWFRGPASQLFEFVWASFDGLVAGGLGGRAGCGLWNDVLGARPGAAGPALMAESNLFQWSYLLYVGLWRRCAPHRHRKAAGSSGGWHGAWVHRHRDRLF